MQLGTLPKCFDPWCLGIAVDLLHGFLPLQLRLRVLAVLAYDTKFAFGQHFQFENVAMLRRVMGKVGQEEEVASLSAGIAPCCW